MPKAKQNRIHENHQSCRCWLCHDGCRWIRCQVGAHSTQIFDRLSCLMCRSYLIGPNT
ncbi:hypothetical protein EJF18_20082 [Clavispora lusitaniae]|uniref:Uncharacterized protein n=1 Tax=Clavispora lusitaniae TaxID=36911 RepID=A0ACD0WFM8_CLALS|nr:hypothetical protein EJF14_20082 [Clavispora lusitaniae]QFZ31854.1 hypothetical protein EJF16_20082 [Clavispora lusitaniae]QFZ37523.1 hypothetical protein EJF15_20082 [Clavispora lusitaniae]QFZ43207.1 hypothetical protein EJF18_20082 [Clavispora lusitaniae]QFZ48883.1 hypothetical protein EJF17_20082 [Clavispora lusitaniae]